MALPPVAFPNVHPDEDARNLRDAMKGMGTDEKTLIKIICNRSRQQLQAVQASFKAKYGKDLSKELKKETSGNFLKVLLYRLKASQFDLKKKGLLKAVKGAGTNERRLIDILAFTPNAEMALIKGDRVLADKIIKDVSGHFKDAIKDLLGADRSENPQINPAELAEDAKVLYNAGEKRLGTDEKTFIKILTNKAPWYNQALNQAYKQARNHSLETAINKEFSGWLKELLIALITPPYEYYAENLYNAMHGAGTNDDVLTWYFGYLEKNELKFVEQIFNKKFPKSLKDMVKADCTGNYEKVLLEMIDHN